jgi:hypothetical protein
MFFTAFILKHLIIDLLNFSASHGVEQKRDPRKPLSGCFCNINLFIKKPGFCFWRPLSGIHSGARNNYQVYGFGTLGHEQWGNELTGFMTRENGQAVSG